MLKSTVWDYRKEGREATIRLARLARQGPGGPRIGLVSGLVVHYDIAGLQSFVPAAQKRSHRSKILYPSHCTVVGYRETQRARPKHSGPSRDSIHPTTFRINEKVHRWNTFAASLGSLPGLGPTGGRDSKWCGEAAATVWDQRTGADGHYRVRVGDRPTSWR